MTSRPTLSNDGRWLLWGHDASGETQVYLAPFPPTGEFWQVSVDGANLGFFTPEDDAIIVSLLDSTFGAGRSVRRIAFQAEPEVVLGPPEPLFSIDDEIVIAGFGPGGQRMVGTLLFSPPARRIIVETAWTPDG